MQMNAGKTAAYVMVAVMLVLACLVGTLVGLLVGGMAGGVLGYAAGSGALRLPGPAGITVPTPSVPFPWVTPPVPLPQVTPQVPLPRRTPPAPLPQLPFPPGQTGALIQTVEPDTPAEKAGLKPGDLIIAVDNATVDESHRLVDLIRAHKPGDKVTLSVLRGNQRLTLEVILGSRRLDTGQEVAYLGVTYMDYPPTGPTD